MASPRAIAAEQAKKIAERFLERGFVNCNFEVTSDSKFEVGEGYHLYSVNDHFSVYEFPVVREGSNSGFILVSGDRHLQPILDYSRNGEGLRSSLVNTLIELQPSARSKTIRWIYAGPFDIIAEMEDAGRFSYVRVPNFRSHIAHERLSFKLKRVKQKWVEERWHFYESSEHILPGPHPHPPPLPPGCNPMFGCQPQDYQQTCRNHGVAHFGSPTANYCAPNCIAGCVSVAWAVYASAMRSLVPVPQAAKIYSDAPDWDAAWPTYPYPPQPGSLGVNARVWQAHGAMATTCDGVTTGNTPYSGNNSLKGQAIFGPYGCYWNFASNTNVNYSWATDPNRHGLPNILTGNSTWNYGADPSDGHAVVCAGYNDQDQHLQVSLGWGNSFPRKWIPFSIVANPCTYFVHSWTLRPSSAENDSRFVRSAKIPSIVNADDG